MKTITPLILSISLLFYLGCQNPPIVKENNVDQKLTLTVYDTIFFETNDKAYAILDFKENIYLGYSFSDYEIVLFNKNGKKVHHFNALGDGPEEYDVINKVGLLEDGKIGVIDNKKVIIFDFEGRFLQSCNYDSAISLPFGGESLLYLIDEENIIFSALNDNIDSDTPDFFEKSHNMTKLNLNTCEMTNFAYYEEKSIYRQAKNSFPTYTSAFFAVNNNRDKVSLVYPFDKNIYSYNLTKSKFSESSSFPTEPSFFGEVKTVKEDTPNAQLRLIKENSYYTSISMIDNFYALQYKTKIPDDIQVETIVQLNAHQGNRKEFIEFMDTSGNRISTDYKLSPMNISKIFPSTSLNNVKLLAYSYFDKGEEIENSVVFVSKFEFSSKNKN